MFTTANLSVHSELEMWQFIAASTKAPTCVVCTRLCRNMQLSRKEILDTQHVPFTANPVLLIINFSSECLIVSTPPLLCSITKTYRGDAHRIKLLLCYSEYQTNPTYSWNRFLPFPLSISRINFRRRCSSSID